MWFVFLGISVALLMRLVDGDDVVDGICLVAVDNAVTGGLSFVSFPLFHIGTRHQSRKRHDCKVDIHNPR